MENSVVLKKCRSGLGMKICGGQTEDGTFTGIFVKKILIGGAVATDGTLQEGDELLSANNESLSHCNNDQAVSILRNAAQTGAVKIIYRRDGASREMIEKLFPSSNDALYAKLRQQSLDNHNGGLNRSDSMSSRFSTSSLEKRSWVYTGQRMSPAPLKEGKAHNEFGSLDKHGMIRMEALDLPVSPRDKSLQMAEDENGQIPRENKKKEAYLDRTSSFDSGFPSSGRFSSPDLTEKALLDSMPVIKIDIAAKSNLGISINGGKNKPDGPHIYVKEVLEGCDAYMDGRIRKGDRIVSINGESFNDVTYEQARSILLRLKLQKHISHYTIRYIVNPDKTSSRIQSMILSPANGSSNKETRQAIIPNGKSRLTENVPLDSSPSNVETLILQSSDEEAVIREMMKMMEKSDDYEIPLVKDLSLTLSDGLTVGREDFQTITDVGSPSKAQYSQIERDIGDVHEISPVSDELQFKPEKFSSPEFRNERNGYSEESPASLERKTLSQYLEEDVAGMYSPQMISPVSSRKIQTGRKSRGRRLSLDPTTKIKVEKLEVALNYLGFEATPSKIRDVRKRVRVGPDGMVTYGEFVKAARDVFDLQLEDRARTLNASTLQFAMRDIEAMEVAARNTSHRETKEYERQSEKQEKRAQQPQEVFTPLLHKAITPQLTIKDIEAIEAEETRIIAQREAERFAEMQAANRRIQDDLARVSRERDDALRELQYLKRQLNEKNDSTSDIEEQLNRSRQEVANAHREIGELRTRTHLVSTALQGAKQREQKFEEKIEMLQSEIEEGKSKNNNNVAPKQREFNELQKRLVVLGCQLRKTEVSKRTYEVAVEKLTKFAERVHDTVDGQRTPTQSRRNSTGKGKAPRPPNVESLAQEARDTVRAVKLLLEEEPLPFGWEEVYAPDGTRYYINHVTQTTSWLHPVSGVQHAGSGQDGMEGPPTDKKF